MGVFEWWEVQLILFGCVGTFLMMSVLEGTQLLWSVFRRRLNRRWDWEWLMMCEKARQSKDV
jgi:hypothetical protein